LADQRAQVAAELTPLGNTLAAVINRRFAFLEGLWAFVRAELVSTNGFPQSEFMDFAAGLHAGSNGIRSFVVAPGGVARLVYPLAGSEDVVGRDMLRDERPNVRADVERAIRSRRVALSGRTSSARAVSAWWGGRPFSWATPSGGWWPWSWISRRS
jgi:sensor domain CHASE-containing protein